MSITKITTPELLDFPNDSTSSANTSGTIIPTGNTYISGGGGQLEESLTLTVGAVNAVTVTVGDKGNKGSTSPTNGGDSTISGTFSGSPITSTGGGAGTHTSLVAVNGGSGSGAHGNDTNDAPIGSSTPGLGTAGQGYPGGLGFPRRQNTGEAGGGGGGAGEAGSPATYNIGGDGGIGVISYIKNAAGDKYAGGGGGGGRTTGGSAISGYGGGDGSGSSTASDADVNSGGGGGSAGGNVAGTGGDGGSGAIVIRYPSSISATYTAGSGGVATVDNTIGNDRYAYVTAGTGSIEFSGTPSTFTADFLVVAGGGGGGQDERGGGGAGGLRTSYGIKGPATGDDGEFRYNEQYGYVEYYDGSAWYQINTEHIPGQPTSCIVNYPTNCNALYQFQNDVTDTNNCYDGVAHNITYGTGKFGQAAIFDGSTSYIELPAGRFQGPEYTISAWIKTDNAGSGSAQAIWGNVGYVNGLTFQGVIFAVMNAGLRVQQYGGGTTSATSTGIITDGTWHHAVLSYNSTTSKIYLDGTLLLTASVTGPSYIDYPCTPSIGCYMTITYSTPVWEFFDGSIDQFRIFPSILTDTQVASLYTESVCN